MAALSAHRVLNKARLYTVRLKTTDLQANNDADTQTQATAQLHTSSHENPDDLPFFVEKDAAENKRGKHSNGRSNIKHALKQKHKH